MLLLDEELHLSSLLRYLIYCSFKFSNSLLDYHPFYNSCFFPNKISLLIQGEEEEVGGVSVVLLRCQERTCIY